MREQAEFDIAFQSGCEMWTSEDGTLVSLAIKSRDDWQEVLQREFAHIFAREAFDASRHKQRFAYREYVGRDFFDGNSGRSKGKVWRIGDELTPFPVIEYELTVPR